MKQTSLYAGRFSAWLRTMRNALAENHSMTVPCGKCNACCRSSFFIHIKPEETHTLRRIPIELLFPTPLCPEGYIVMGHDQHGRCPMLIKNKCSIYADRPAACRIFDCRILSASGIKETENNLVVQQARRWEFSCPTQDDRNQLLSVKVHDVFFSENNLTAHSKRAVRDSVLAKRVLKSYMKFEKHSHAA